MSTCSSTSHSWPAFQRHPAVALRQEQWGGFAFHRGHGDLLELDEQGFEVLAALARATNLHELRFAIGRNDRPSRLPELAHFVGDLEQRGFVQKTASAESRPAHRSFGQLAKVQFTEQQFRGDSRDLSAPLVAHWAVTYRCNLACPFCYSESGPHREREPAAQIRRRIVGRLAEWGVFEVALGGGEPTILPDFPKLLATIRCHGMMPNVTTNGLSHSHDAIQALAKYAGTIHVSADRPEILDAARGSGVFSHVQETVRRLSANGVRWGVNLLLTPDMARSLERSLVEMQQLGAQAVTLLRPKGAWAADRWAGFPTADDLRSITVALKSFIARRPDMRLYVDTALRGPWSQAGLLEDPEPEVLGCGGGQRHVAITPTGDVYPCSHACRKELRMGNLLDDDLHELWRAGNGYASRQQYRRLCGGATCPCQAP